MKQLLAFCGFAHDPQGVLAAIHRVALVASERLYDFRIRIFPHWLTRFELTVAAFANADGGGWYFPYDPQLALFHDRSLSHREGTA